MLDNDKPADAPAPPAKVANRPAKTQTVEPNPEPGVVAGQPALAERPTFDAAPPQPVVEGHLLSDLTNASQVLVGCSPDVLAGAAHKAGWEMTETVTVEQAKQAVSEFLSIPA